MSNVIPFRFAYNDQDIEVRVVGRKGDPWFILVDVCRALEIGNPSDAARRIDADEKDTLDNVEGGNFNDLGAVGAMPTIINESGLYSLILTSRKPAAKRFKKWVTAEVLPSIRKTGSYSIKGNAPTENQLLERITVAIERQAHAVEALSSDLGGVKDDVKSMKGEIHAQGLRLKKIENNSIKRKPFQKGVVGLHALVVLKKFGGLCPCGCETRIVYVASDACLFRSFNPGPRSDAFVDRYVASRRGRSKQAAG